MIIVRSPLRVSLVGGGTDLPSFFGREPGNVISFTIDKYIYITINTLAEYFPWKFLLKYSKTENVQTVDEIQHPLLRECIRLSGLTRQTEITSMADIPAGTGLGSSSAYCVGLLKALSCFLDKDTTKRRLAEDACNVEINILQEPIGKQDQYAAAYGGLRCYKFQTDGKVVTDLVTREHGHERRLRRNLMIFYTGITRSASTILQGVKKQTGEEKEKIFELQKRSIPYVKEVAKIINTGKDLTRVGEILHECWLLKKSWTSDISNSEIDTTYNLARDAGALGGKITGAGGGGFLLLFVTEDKQQSVREALSHLKEVVFRYDRGGAKVVYDSE
jgi:D-glycero-alpha-D-manno-heptose-7-phosphate kinase